MGDVAELIRDTYRAFNDRDLDGALSVMHEDVDWPNGWEGGRVIGRTAVRDYWTRQWAAIDPKVDPVGIAELPDGRVEVRVHQVVRDLDGNVVADSEVLHIYRFREGLMERMDIGEKPGN